LAVFVSVVFVGFGVLGIALLFFELGFRLENERKNKEKGGGGNCQENEFR
jgi:mannose/fructose/N-acetylgalactosamine-specific phosphotransferase system component IIC